VRRWLDRYGYERAAALLAVNNRPPGTVVRVNRRRSPRETVLRRLRSDGLDAQPGHLADGCLRLPVGAEVFSSALFRDGHLTVQDESEALVAPLVNPRPGDRVLDLCAAPGGKLGHLAELGRGEIMLVGVERHPSRLRRTREGLERLGHHDVALVCADGRTFGRPESFDRVLVDAPCSGLGVLRRRADARWRKTESLLVEMVELQAELLDRAAVLVRPGGAIVYSVCSFEPEECEQQVDRFVERHPSFRIERPGPGFPATVVDERGFYRIFHDQFESDGAFAARLRRLTAEEERQRAAAD
jgi:16S rRNA (cytosine967-C5)-methyltransferase